MSTGLRSLGVAALLAAGLGCSPPAPRPCRAEIDVRLGAPDPLEEGAAVADNLRVLIGSHGVPVAQAAGPLARDGRLELETPEGEPLELPESSELVLSLVAVSSADERALAAGRTARFACRDGGSTHPVLFLGRANGFTAAGLEALPERLGATATALPSGHLLLAGGESASGAAVAPAAQRYDHATGASCDAGTCLGGALAARVEHTATLLGDGSVLLVGGRTPGTTTLLDDVVRFDPVTGSFQTWPQRLVARAQHVAIELRGPGVPAGLAGKVLVAGGCTGTCALEEVSADALLLDPAARSVTTIASLTLPRRHAAAVALPAGEVLVTGGLDAAGAPLASFERFVLETQTFSGLAPPCPGGGAGTLCGGRARHTATLLDDGNVLLWGGIVAPASSPNAEVIVWDRMQAVPLADTAAPSARIGHTATRLACLGPPCRVLIAGGKDPTTGTWLPPLSVSVAPAGVHAERYAAQLSAFTRVDSAVLRSDQAAAVMGDGAVLLVGGASPDGEPAPAMAFTACESPPASACPAP